MPIAALTDYTPQAALGSVESTASKKNYDLEAEFMAAMYARLEIFDKALSEKISDMKTKTQKANAANKLLSVLNKIKSTFSANSSYSDKISKETLNRYDQELQDAQRATGFQIKLITNGNAATSVQKSLDSCKEELAKIDQTNSALESRIAAIDSLPSDSLNENLKQESISLKQEKIVNLSKKEKILEDLSFLEKGSYPPGYRMNSMSENSTTKKLIEDAAIDVQSIIDESNSTNQMEQVELQGLMGKRSGLLEMSSTVLKRLMDTNNSIISKM